MRIDPLYTLIVLGGLIFAGVSFLSPPPASDRKITVDRATLLEFIQYRVRAFDVAAAEKILDDMSGIERKALVNDFLSEEILYREAKQLKMDETDYVIRRRMAQKLEFMNDALVDVPSPSENDLESFFEKRKNDFAEAGRISFVHVFKENSDLNLDLIRQGLTPQNSVEFSDLFAYQLAYADRPRDLVLAHFGKAFTDQLFDPQVPLRQWLGPLSSPHGTHLVYVSARQAGYVPTLDAIRGRVSLAWMTEEKQRKLEGVMARLRASYEIEIDIDININHQSR